MKKRLILLLAIFITFMGSFAQQATSTQRLKFMGKSMDCSMSEMATYLQTKGCKLEDKKEGLVFLSGTFQGYLCDFVLKEDYGILSSCNVILPGNYDESWTKLESDYNRIVEKFIQKYGIPLISKSEFEGYPYSDYEKLRFVRDGKCNYRSIFFIDGGFIQICITDDSRVLIMYIDSIARDRIMKLQQDEL